MLLVTGAVQGAGAELIFAATRWRNYSLPVMMAAGVGAAIFSFAYTWVRFNYGALQPGILIAMFTLRCVSGALLGGWMGHVIVQALSWYHSPCSASAFSRRAFSSGRKATLP